MAYHVWGDSWFTKYGDDLNAAVQYIGGNCRRWGRIGGQYKEKWGVVCFYAHLHYQLHDLVFPGYCWIRWSNLLHRLDLDISFSKLYCKTIKPLVHAYQAWIYKTVYLRAIVKWPHLRAEILNSADWKELFPIEIQRESNKTWFRSANPGELIYIGYKHVRAVVGDDNNSNKIILQDPDGGIYNSIKTLYRHWDGCGVS